jgi:RNase P subunit RPR2
MNESIKSLGCPKCGKPMEPKLPAKQTFVEPNLGEPLVEFDCKECGHVEGRHVKRS